MISLKIEENEKIDISSQKILQNMPQNNELPKIFGHTLTKYSNNKLVLFGGAYGLPNKFTTTNTTFQLDLPTQKWKKIQNIGSSPSSRAYHSTVYTQNNQIVLYGGLLNEKQQTDYQLYYLQIRQNLGYWGMIVPFGRTPGKRYGHSLIYVNNDLIIFGGKCQNNILNDCWSLNIKSNYCVWKYIQIQGSLPQPRYFHSSILLNKQKQKQIIIFGGKTQNNQILNNTWKLSIIQQNKKQQNKYNKYKYKWIKIQYKQNNKYKPYNRYQHCMLNINQLIIIIGGKNNKIYQTLPIQIYNINTNIWYNFIRIQRYAHVIWYDNYKYIYVYGGFGLLDNDYVNSGIIKINLRKLLYNNKQLYNKIFIEQKKQVLKKININFDRNCFKIIQISPNRDKYLKQFQLFQLQMGQNPYIYQSNQKKNKQNDNIQNIPNFVRQSAFKRQQIQRMKIQKQKQQIQNMLNCVICLNQKKDCLNAICYHLACCFDCGKSLSKCPICRGDMLPIRIYL